MDLPESISVLDRVGAEHGDEGVQEQAQHEDDLQDRDPKL
jgi:hypothetical protein